MLSLVEANDVDLPLDDIELFEMVTHSHPLTDSLLAVLDLSLLATVAVGEVRPAVLRRARLVVDHQVVSETGTVLTMHPNCKLLLKRHKSQAFEVFPQRKDEGLPRGVFFIFPSFGRSPWNSAKSTDKITVLCFGDSEGILFTVTNLMKGFG